MNASWCRVCLGLVCIVAVFQPLFADGSADASNDSEEIAKLRAELSGLLSKESAFAEQSAKLASQLAEAKKQAESSAAEAEQLRKAKENAEKELQQCE